MMQVIKRFICNHIAILLIAISSIIVACGFGFSYCNLSEYWRGIAVEAAGTCWDILLVVVLLGVYDTHRRKMEKIKELQRRIDDFKKLKNEYGNAMIGASLRQLAELGETAINFTGIELSHFRFSSDQGIHDLKGSKFSHGASVRQYERWSSDLEYVSFSNVDCTDVIFGNGNLSLCHLTNCDFSRSTLCGARFKWVFLKCSEDMLKRDEQDWFEEIGQVEDGSPQHVGPIYTPMFSDADLMNACFDEAFLENIDFRGAKNILTASFVNTRGLETCLFDDGVKEGLKIQ